MDELDEQLTVLADRLSSFPPAPLAELERRVARNRRRRLVQRASAAGLALLLVAVTGALALSRRSSGPHRVATAAPSTPTTTGTTIAGGTTPSTGLPHASGDAPLDLTWISATHGWALTRPAGCANCIAIRTTTDGGNSWAPVGAPTACYAMPESGCGPAAVTMIRFANANEGYLFGPDLFVTHDGGNSWTSEQSPRISLLEIAGSTAIRVSFSQSGCPGPCDWSVDRAPVGSTDWQPLAIPPIAPKGEFASLVREGKNDVYVSLAGNPAGGGTDAQAQLLISHDGGDTWTNRADPCGYTAGAENDTIGLAAAPGNVVAVLCTPRVDFSAGDFVVLSNDGGDTFGPQQRLPTGASPLRIAALDKSDVAVSSVKRGDIELLLTHDSGATWTVAAHEPARDQPGGPSYLGFETATTGWWITTNGTLWTTQDGGQTWTAQHL